MIPHHHSDPPTVAVVLWVSKATATPSFLADLAALATRPPDESAEYDGVIDFHWWFDDSEEGEELAANLNAALSGRPGIIVLRLSHYVDDTLSVSYRELRDVKH